MHAVSVVLSGLANEGILGCQKHPQRLNTTVHGFYSVPCSHGS